MIMLVLCFSLLYTLVPPTLAWTTPTTSHSFIPWLTPTRVVRGQFPLLGVSRDNLEEDDEEEWSDFADMGYIGSTDSSQLKEESSRDLPPEKPDVSLQASLQSVIDRSTQLDYTGIQSRRFSLGPDLILSDFVGNMGFDKVTDWQYERDGQVVSPNPMDASQPRRTRTSSGSVVRIFRGELVGQLGGTVSSRGLDRRVLVKEFSGELALSLAEAELRSLGVLQSKLIDSEDASEWIRVASSRSVELRRDNGNVAQLIDALRKAPFIGILGEVDLGELDDLEPNEFYRALGVPPPKPEAVWIVYEYAGLSTIQEYSQPGEVRRSKLPPKRGIFGNVIEPPRLPLWPERANYVVNGIMKGAILAVEELHENSLVHQSIGRTSFILSSAEMDKREAVSPFTTMTTNLRVKLSDFGFSTPVQELTNDEEFRARARTFGITLQPGENTLRARNFAIAEDMHALGFVFLGLLLTSLAELPTPFYQMPATDEDTLQRLLVDIFDKDFAQLRDYVEAEEVWSRLVDFLDADERAGWKVLETLMLARERVATDEDLESALTVRGLLASKLFS